MKSSYTVVVEVAYFGGKRLVEGQTIDLTEKQAEHLVRLGQLQLTSEVRAKAKTKA